jgi:oxalate decarboxylase/phosphoglucose isomerase-like protein (cupin superfamily)
MILGGKTVKADRETFPALIGSHASMTLGFIGPCGFNTPHVHPRAAELNIVVQGRLMGSVTAENGARHMQHTLNQYQMTVFPQGALHTEWNPDCEPAVFVAAFPSEDPGVQQAAQTFFGFEDDVIQAALGGDGSVNGQDLDKFKALIPPNVALGVESCLKKCNIGTT